MFPAHTMTGIHHMTAMASEVGTPHADPRRAWTAGPVPAPHALSGFHSATLSEEGYEKTAAFLLDVMLAGNEGNRCYREPGGILFESRAAAK